MIEDVAAVVAFLAGCAVLVVDWFTEEPTPEEQVRQQYAAGEISLDELERRLEVLADPEAQRIREAVEQVSGIGEATSWTIAERYGSLAELRRADVAELQEVSNVGEQRATAIKERLS